MRKYTKAHFDNKITYLGKFLKMIKVLEFFYKNDVNKREGYITKFNLFNPLSYMFIVLLCISGVFSQVVSKDVSESIFDDLYDSVSKEHDLVPYSDFPDK